MNAKEIGLIIARASLPAVMQLPDAHRAAAFAVLASITPAAESEQFLIARTAILQAADAQLLLTEILANATTESPNRTECVSGI